MREILSCILLIILFFFEKGYGQNTTYPLRILSANVGNATPFASWENKLELAGDVIDARNYIQYWQPDIILFSEIYDASQMKTTNHNGPVLPANYDFSCGKNVMRDISGQTSWFPPANWSHEHECVAWKSSVFELVPNSAISVYGRDDAWGKNNCNYDFTAHRVQLKHKRYKTIFTAVAIHPNSTKSGCRTYEISNYWSQLVGNNSNAIIAGDWNTDNDAELQKPANFQTIFSKGNYWDLANFPNDYSATYIIGDKHLDHAFSNFGTPCTNCGSYYNNINLQYGVALGGYQGHPRMDNGHGFDHRQILVDINVPYTLFPLGSLGLQVKDLVRISNLTEIVSNKFLTIDENGYIGYFEYPNSNNTTNTPTMGAEITDETQLLNVPLIDSNKLLTIDNYGNIGFQMKSISNNTYEIQISGTKGLDLQFPLQLKKMTIKPEKASSFYILVINNEGIIGKRPITDIL